MDTRSKSIDALKIRKITAFVFAVLFFLSAGLFSGFFARGFFHYDRYERNGNYFTTDVFRYAMNDYESEMLYCADGLDCETPEEYEQTNAGKEIKANYDKQKKDVSEAFDYLSKKRVLVSVTGDNCYRYEWNGHYFDYEGVEISFDEYYSYNYDRQLYYEEETVTQAEPTTAKSPVSKPEKENKKPDKATTAVEVEQTTSGSPVVTDADGDVIYQTTLVIRNEEGGSEFKISDSLYDIFYYTGGLNYGEASKEDLLKAVDNLCKSEIESLFNERSINNGYYFEQENTTLKYAVFYKDSKKMVSNCGVTEKDSLDTIRKKMNGDYLEYYENGKFKIDNETKVINDEFYGDIAEAMKGTHTSELEYNNDRIERAYFAYAGNGEKEAINLSKAAYDKYYDISSIHGRGENNNLNFYIITAIICFILAVICCIYLFKNAGRLSDGTIRLRFYDKIPFALNIVITGLLLAGFGVLFGVIYYYEFNPVELFLYNDFPKSLAGVLFKFSNEVTTVCFAGVFLTLIGFISSIIRNVRNHTFFKHTLVKYIVRFFKFAFSLTLKFFRFVKAKVSKLVGKASSSIKNVYAADVPDSKHKRRLILVCIIAVAFCIFTECVVYAVGFTNGRRYIHSVLSFIVSVGIAGITAYIVWLVILFDRISMGVKQIKLGSFFCDINTKFMPPFMRELAENISSIRDGLQSAVNQAVKDQAMKAELLTNVTHDLKTPLTSVITYVDLLKREGLDGEHAAEYVDVIDDKSQKLKKLVDDLVQASKASSGAIDLNPVKLDLCEFAAQTAGEYADELKEAGIDLIPRMLRKNVYVIADAKLTDRVFENLISNIKKYSMKNTRAYIEVNEENGYGVISFKNISDTPLDMDVEKLTTRFYRGDSSRSGEGTGLGLSIAEDLCILQKGKFEITLDGDLFKATVSLPSDK